MIRSIKALGLLVVAALAIGAMGASAAQAEVTLTSGLTENAVGEVEHTATEVVGEQEGSLTENYLETENGQVVACNNAEASFLGKTTGTDASLTLTPTYGECGIRVKNAEEKHELKRLVTITMEGCTYKFNRPTFLAANTYTGTVDLECPSDQGPLVHIYANAKHTIQLCTLEIEPTANTNLNHVIYHNKTKAGNPDDITAEVTVEGIKYIELSAGCPEPGTHSGGKLFTNATLSSIKGHDLWLSGE